MRINKEGEPRKKLPIFSWDSSCTGSWSIETGLHKLRDNTPEELVEMLWPWGIQVQNTAIIELMAHGNPRKAAALARALVAAHPVAENSIRKGFGDDLGNLLLVTPLETIPSTPAECAKNAEIEYIQ